MNLHDAWSSHHTSSCDLATTVDIFLPKSVTLRNIYNIINISRWCYQGEEIPALTRCVEHLQMNE